MATLKVPGVAYAVVRGDEVVAQVAWGLDGDGNPFTARTPLVLGSTTKSFTALVVMQLVEAGRVELDAPVRTYLPWFRLDDEDATGRITIRQLLLQTSGLPGVATRGLTDRYDNRRRSAGDGRWPRVAPCRLPDHWRSSASYCSSPPLRR